jgi:hypothetical protein
MSYSCHREEEMKFHINKYGAVVCQQSAERKFFIQKEDLEELRALLRRMGSSTVWTEEGKEVENVNRRRRVG